MANTEYAIMKTFFCFLALSLLIINVIQVSYAQIQTIAPAAGNNSKISSPQNQSIAPQNQSIAPQNQSLTIQSCHCVAFRLDDIQDYHLNNAQIAVIDLFEAKNASLTLGVIGNHIGNDTKLINHIKDTMKNSINNNFHIEIANHGWNHEDFTQFSLGEQAQLMHQANEKITTVLGVVPQVFIAPMSLFNNATLHAAQNNNIHYFSASESHDSPPYNLRNITSLYHFPETATTGDIYANGSNWYSIPAGDIFSRILSSWINMDLL